jgi:hypothetical protein
VNVAGISLVRPSNGVNMHWLIRFDDGSCQRKDIHPIHALRQAAELLDGAAFILGKTEK